MLKYLKKRQHLDLCSHQASQILDPKKFLVWHATGLLIHDNVSPLKASSVLTGQFYITSWGHHTMHMGRSVHNTIKQREEGATNCTRHWRKWPQWETLPLSTVANRLGWKGLELSALVAKMHSCYKSLSVWVQNFYSESANGFILCCWQVNVV